MLGPPPMQAAPKMPPATAGSKGRLARALGFFARPAQIAGEGGLVVLLLATAVFLALRIIPGDAAALVLGDQASPEALATLRAELGLDRSLFFQYVQYLRGLATLDLGSSLRRPGTSAFARVGEALTATASLAFLATGIALFVGVALGLLASGPWLPPSARTRLSRLLDGAAAVPLLAVAPAVTWLFAVRFPLVPLPGDPDAGLRGLLFAGGLLAFPLSVHLARTSRTALRTTTDALFVRVARAKGASPFRAQLFHALPAVSAPILTVVATQLGALLGGAVVLEKLFERRGLGTLLLEAYAGRDLPVLEATVVTSGLLFVAVQTLASLLQGLLDPRAR